MERVRVLLRSPGERQCEMYAGLDQMISRLKQTYDGPLEMGWLEEVRSKLGLRNTLTT
jgi:hypothetical protein